MKRYFTPLLLVSVLLLAGCSASTKNQWQDASYSGEVGGYVSPP